MFKGDYMPNIGAEGGLAGLFGGISEGAKYINEKRSKSEDLYLTLSQNKSLRLKNGKQFKPGMTRVQVMDLFEENPESTSRASYTQFLTPEEGRALKQFYPKDLAGIPEDKISYGFLQEIQRRSERGLQREKLDETVYSRMEKYKVAWENLKNKETEQGNDIIKKLIDVSVNTVTDFEELISPKSPFRKPIELMLKRRGINIKDKPADSTWQDFITKMGFERSTESEVEEEPTLPKPAVENNDASVQSNWTDEERNLARQLRAKGDPSSRDELLQKARIQLQGSQINPTGVMETPGMEQKIGDALQQPVGTPVLQTPQAPTSQSYMQTSVLPKQATPASNPNQHILELARQYRDKLANSPYQVA